MKRLAKKWETIFANHNSTKDEYPDYIKNSQNSTMKNILVRYRQET